MALQKRDWFTAETTGEQFLAVCTKVYGPSETLKFEWYSGMSSIYNDGYDVQLFEIIKTDVSTMGIPYVVNLWEA